MSKRMFNKFKDIDQVKLDYSDVMIVPKYSTINSRSEVVVDYNPIIASNMDGVGTFEMAEALASYGARTAIVKHYSYQEWVNFIDRVDRDILSCVFVSTGIAEVDIERTTMIVDYALSSRFVHLSICIDVANGYMFSFLETVKKLKDKYPDHTIMAGSVVTPDGVVSLENAGADLIKVGIGSGAVCTTRIKTGIGYPQLSAVYECVLAAEKSGIVADGGITNPGDVCKALAVGAEYVKLGSLLAGHIEGGGNIVTDDNGEQHVQFYGMSSRTAQEKHVGFLADYKSSEGRTVNIPFRGPVEFTIKDILGGVRSACAYTNSKKVSELWRNTELIRVNNQYNKHLEHYTVSI